MTAPKGRSFAALALATSLVATFPSHPQDPPPGTAQDAAGEGGALDWDRDFDLILESRQGKEREDAKKRARVDALEANLAGARAELADMGRKRKLFEGNVLGDEAMAEMLRLEARTASEALRVLDARMAEVRARISDLEDDLKRLRRAR